MLLLLLLSSGRPTNVGRHGPIYLIAFPIPPEAAIVRPNLQNLPVAAVAAVPQ